MTSVGNVNPQKQRKRIRNGKEGGLYNELHEYTLALKLYKVIMTAMYYSWIYNIYKNNMYKRNR